MKRHITLLALFSITYILAAPDAEQRVTKRWPEASTDRYRYGHALDKSRLTTRSRHRSRGSHFRSRLDHVSKISASEIKSELTKETRSNYINDTQSAPKEEQKSTDSYAKDPHSSQLKKPSEPSPSLSEVETHPRKTILPLKRIDNLHSNIQNPYISFQLRLNRALKRHSFFLNKSISDEELIMNLRKRADSIGFELEIRNQPTEDEPERSSLHLRKRQALEPQSGQPFVPTGSVPDISSGLTGSQGGQPFVPTGSVPDISSGLTGSQSGQPFVPAGSVPDISSGLTGSQSGQPFSPTGSVPDISSGLTGSQGGQPFVPTGAVPDGSSPGTTSDPSSSLPSSNSSSSFSQKKLKALVNNLVTDPEDTTAHNSIGFSIHSNDIAYFATIKVGTPTQEFNVIMDSGSSDFWLSGPSCSNSQSRTSTCFHKTLSKSSSTFKPSNKPFQVTYGTGQVSGFLIQEDVEIAGLKLNSHTFGATTQESKEFASKDVPFDGLMGTALSTLSTSRLITPIESLAKNGKISGAFVGYALGRAGEDSNIGQVTIGGVDESKFEAPLTMFKNINQRGFWEGTLSSLNINGKPMISSRTTIFDTGTSLMIVPSSDAQKIHSGIPDARSDGQGSFLLPCNTNVKVSLIFEGKEFVIKSSDLAVQPVNLNDLNGMCLSGIAAGQIGGQNQWLLGDIFLKNVYFVTDATNNEIGLAVIKNNT